MKTIESNPNIYAPLDSDFKVDALKVLQNLLVCSAPSNNRGLKKNLFTNPKTIKNSHAM